MAWQDAGKIKVKGHTISLAHNPDTGRWGTNYGNYDSREEAVRAAAAEIERENDRDRIRSQEQDAKNRAYETRTVKCDTCGIRTTNIKTHERSKKHQNAAAWNEHSRRSRY